MTTFDEREAGFEAKFTHDADVEFRIVARANKLFGQWAAGKLGLAADAADDYARSIVHAEFEAAGLAGSGVDYSVEWRVDLAGCLGSYFGIKERISSLKRFL